MIPFRTLLFALAIAALASPPAVAGDQADGAARATARAARAVWLAHYQDTRQGPEQSERFSRTFNVGAEGALDLQNLAGDVRVSTGRGNEIQVEAVKRVRHREASEARRLLGELRIDVSEVGNRVEVRTIFPRTNDRGLSASVDYTITVPQNTAVALRTISGDIEVAGVRGEVRAESVSGDVQVTSTPNLAVAKTVSGNVTARDITAASALALGSISGSIIASALKARTLDCGTVSGNMELSNMTIERLQAKSVSGDIAFDATLARGGRYEFNSHSGNVRVTVPANAGFELDATSFSGDIRSELPVTMRGPDLPGGGGRRFNRTVRGTYGDASAILSVRSFSGDVVIVKK